MQPLFISPSEQLSRRLLAYRRRRQQRGTALFVTVMVVTLLSAVGLYAMGAASLATQAVGFNRQGVRTYYAAEFAARTFAAYLSGREADWAVPTDDGDCRSNLEIYALNATLVSQGGNPIPTHCKTKDHQELWREMDYTDISDSSAMLGTLSERSPLEAAFKVQFTDLYDATKPVKGHVVGDGSDPSHQFVFKVATVTATAHVRPQMDEDSTDAAILSASSVQRLRAQILLGPVQKN